MPDMEKVIKALENCKEGGSCDGCSYDTNTSRCIFRLHEDALAMLKEQEEQKRKWLQAIADTQLAVSPTGYETEIELAKRTGEWNGLQMAFEMLTEGR